MRARALDSMYTAGDRVRQLSRLMTCDGASLTLITPSFAFSLVFRQDIADSADTEIIFSFKSGAGVAQHPNANRGASTLNFLTGDVDIDYDCNENFATLHGALMLVAWMVLAPWGIYYARCGFPFRDCEPGGDVCASSAGSA